MKNIKENNYRKVAVTGIGIISALGNDQVQSLESLLNSETALSNIEFLNTKHSKRIKVGEVKLSNEELANKLNLSDDHNFTRTALLGCLAATEAIKNSRISDASISDTALISATTVGGMDKTELYYKEFSTNGSIQKYINSHVASDSTTKIADYLGINGFVSTVSTACSSAANAIMLGARLINQGRIERVIVGGTDALSKFTLNGFNSLMLLSEKPCTPFDKDRQGLNLGEGAAYLVLESEESINKSRKQVFAYLKGFANANDAFHQTASSDDGEGAYLAMTKALEMAKLNPNEIDYINAHGTATPNNDKSEGRALKRIFGNTVPSFSSTKAYTGHCLGSAAAIEAVISVLSLQGNVVFPNLHFKTPIPEFDNSPLTSLEHKSLKHVLSNSFGFGGNCSTLIFSKE